jgi:hypothetical protein
LVDPADFTTPLTITVSAGDIVRFSAGTLGVQAATGSGGTASIGAYLPLAGGTLSGPLLLAGDPTDTLQAATKGYVDAHSGSGGGPGFLPLSGGTMLGPLNYTATGGTTSRSAQDRAHDWINVTDFGAKMDGTTDNLAAFNAARGVASFNGVIQVPRGSTVFPNGITAGITTPVLWKTDGTTFPGGASPIITLGLPGDVTEGFFNGNKYFGKRSMVKGPGAVLRVDMIQTDTTGGNTTDICNGINVVTQQNLGNTNQIWGIAVVGDAYADGTSGGFVGIQSTVRKHAGAQAWAVQTVTLDDTGLASSANGHGMLGAEIAVRALNVDDAGNTLAFGGVGIRKGIHLTMNRAGTAPADNETSFSNAFWVSGDSLATKTYISSVYGVDTTVDCYSVFDARGAGAPFNYGGNPVAAVRMSAGQIVDLHGGTALNSPPGDYLWYDAATSKIKFNHGTTTIWSIDANGNMRTLGTITPSVAP